MIKVKELKQLKAGDKVRFGRYRNLTFLRVFDGHVYIEDRYGNEVAYLKHDFMMHGVVEPPKISGEIVRAFRFPLFVGYCKIIIDDIVHDVIDISNGGLAIVSDELNLRKGEEIKHVPVEFKEHEIMVVDLEVRHTTPTLRHGEYTYGFKVVGEKVNLETFARVVESEMLTRSFFTN